MSEISSLHPKLSSRRHRSITMVIIIILFLFFSNRGAMGTLCNCFLRLNSGLLHLTGKLSFKTGRLVQRRPLSNSQRSGCCQLHISFLEILLLLNLQLTRLHGKTNKY